MGRLGTQYVWRIYDLALREPTAGPPRHRRRMFPFRDRMARRNRGGGLRMIQDASINILTYDVDRLAGFYKRLDFRETYRLPRTGKPDHVEVTLNQFTIGISTVEAAISVHGLHPSMGGRPVAIILWTDDTDGYYARLTAEGAPSLSPPRDFLSDLRTAWIADPDGNPVNLVQRRRPKG